LDRRLGGSQCRSGRGGEEKNSRPRRELNPDRSARSPAITALCVCIYITYMYLFKQYLEVSKHDVDSFIICNELVIKHEVIEGWALHIINLGTK
jgi:hypothetical protein